MKAWLDLFTIHFENMVRISMKNRHSLAKVFYAIQEAFYVV